MQLGLDYCIILAGWQVAKKKKPKPFRAVKAVKSAAREQIGMPQPTRRQSSIKERKREKHKPTFGDLLADQE